MMTSTTPRRLQQRDITNVVRYRQKHRLCVALAPNTVLMRGKTSNLSRLPDCVHIAVVYVCFRQALTAAVATWPVRLLRCISWALTYYVINSYVGDSAYVRMHVCIEPASVMSRRLSHVQPLLFCQHYADDQFNLEWSLTWFASGRQQWQVLWSAGSWWVSCTAVVCYGLQGFQR